MINVSNEYKEVLGSEDRQFYAHAEITLKDSTVLNLDNSNILDIKIDDASTPNGQFTIGSAIINQLTLQINNLYDEFSDYDFTDAIIRPSVGLQLSETVETVHKGVFIADDPKAIGSVINLTAFDNMSKFDRPFSEVTQVFPCTIRDLLITVCNHCDVSLATSTLYNQDYVVEARPDDDAISCREIVSWIAQISVSFAKINNQGSLELRWYDMSGLDTTSYDGGIFDNDTPYSSGDNIDGGTFTSDGDNIDGGGFTNLNKFHHIYSLYNRLDIAIDDVVITGVSVSDPVTTENKVLYGETGYVISLEGNKLIQGDLSAHFVAQSIGQKIIGMRFRPFETTTRSDPTIETGDASKVSDRKGNVYHSIVTNFTYQISKPCRISCEAESPLRNSSTRYSETAKAIVEARKHVDKKLTAYDLAVQRMTSLIVHAFGLYRSEEILEDGSKIFYSHDKPTRAESSFVYQENSNGFFVSNDGGQTWNSGWDADGNAIFNVLSAIGVNVEWLKATGPIEGFEIIANKGKIAGLNITESGLASDNDIVSITNAYNEDGEPIQGKIKVRDSIPNPEEGITDSYSEVSGDGFNSIASHSTDPFNYAKTETSLTPIYGLNIKTLDSYGQETDSLNLDTMVMIQDNIAKLFYMMFCGGSEMMMFSEDGTEISSQTKIELVAPTIKLNGYTMSDINNQINYNLSYIINIVSKLASMGIVVDPPPPIS